MIKRGFYSLSIYERSFLTRGIYSLYLTNTYIHTVKPVLSGHSKRRPKLVFNTYYPLMQVKSIAECSKGSILQYFRPSLSYFLSLRSLFCLLLSGRLRQGLLYFVLLYDWRESCLLIGPICLHKSLCLPENWSNLAQKVI